MRDPRPLLLAWALCLLPPGAGLAHAQAKDDRGRTVWDGVYTDAQADRATAVFDQACSRCHSLAPEGRSPLSGPAFWESNAQGTVDGLLAYVKTSMPNGNGGSLPAEAYNDLVALILRSNGFPSGQTALAPGTIAGVRIVPKNGSDELPANALVRVVGCLARTGGDWVLTHATAPVRADQAGAPPEDASRPLGDRTTVLRFVITRLDAFAGQRVSVRGMLLGAGGVDGINVTGVERVAVACP